MNQVMKALEYVRDGMFVPSELTKEIISKMKVGKNKSILVLFSYEMLPVLCELGYGNVTLVVDNVKPVVYHVAKYYGYNVMTFEEIEEMKFDVVLGNPPYQDTKEDGSRKSKTVNLWSKFISVGMNISKSNGFVAMITPTSWTSPSSDVRGDYTVDGNTRLWDVFNSYSTYANVNDVAKHFKGVGSTFGYFIVDKSKHDGLKFSDGADTSLGFLPKSNFEEVREKLSNENNIGNKYEVTHDNRKLLRVSIPKTRVLNKDSIEILDAGSEPSVGKNSKGMHLFMYVDTKKEAEHVKKKLIEAIDVLNIHCRWSGFIDIQAVKMIKL